MTGPAGNDVARTAPRHGPSIANRLTGLTAIILAVAGVGGLLGHLTGWRLLVQPLGAWPPLPWSVALVLVAIAISLHGTLTGARWRALFASAVPLAMSATALILFASSPDAEAGGLSVAAALIIGTASLGLYVSVIERRPDVQQLTMVIAGVVLVALTLTVLFAKLVGVSSTRTGAVVTGASLQVLVAGLMVGLTLIAIVWARGLTIAEPPRWLPSAAGLAALCTVLFLWRGLVSREQDLARAGARQALEVERRLRLLEIDAITRSMHRFAEWALSDPELEAQASALHRLVRDIPRLAGAVRIDSAGGVLLSVPDGTEFTALALSEAWGRMGTARSDTVLFLPIDDGDLDFAVVAPVCSAVGCQGAVAGVVRVETLFASMLDDSSGDYRYTVTGRDGPVPGSESPDEPGGIASVPMSLGSLQWRLYATPTAALTTRTSSELPTAVLFMGLAMAALLKVTLRLTRTAWQNARQAERARLSVALERATDGIWEWDLTSGMATRSSGLWNYLSYDPARVGTDVEAWLSLIHPDDRSGVERELEAHVAGRIPHFEAEYRVRSGTGDWHVIVDRGRVVDHRADGSPSRMLGISADVTEARAAVAARQASERRFRAIFDSGFQFQLLLDCDGKVLEVNKVALDGAGVAVGDVMGRYGWETLWWQDNPEAQGRLRNACDEASSGRTHVYEQEIPDGGGGTLILEMAVKPILDAEGKASQILVEGRDSTARRRAEAALQEVDTLTTMGRVAARVAHEINNPLAGIQNSFLLIKDAVPPTHPHFKYVGAIEREVGRIARVTRQLYETYRPEQEGSGDASLHTIVGDAVAFLEQVNRAARLTIVTDLEGVPGLVQLPAAMLRQVVYNLVQNAADASPEGGTILVRARVVGRTLLVSVSDEGPGVPPALRERIFDPFFTTQDKRTAASGMGLGLALVRRTVAAARGEIRVEDADGGGACFAVTLPFQDHVTGAVT